jgi:hypothetical protein
MTDPVDTDALRRDARVLVPGFPGVARRLNDAADEVDRLRRDLRKKRAVIQSHIAGVAPLVGMQPARVQIRPNIRVDIPEELP